MHIVTDFLLFWEGHFPVRLSQGQVSHCCFSLWDEQQCREPREGYWSLNRSKGNISTHKGNDRGPTTTVEPHLEFGLLSERIVTRSMATGPSLSQHKQVTWVRLPISSPPRKGLEEDIIWERLVLDGSLLLWSCLDIAFVLVTSPRLQGKDGSLTVVLTYGPNNTILEALGGILKGVPTLEMASQSEI